MGLNNNNNVVLVSAVQQRIYMFWFGFYSTLSLWIHLYCWYFVHSHHCRVFHCVNVLLSFILFTLGISWLFTYEQCCCEHFALSLLMKIMYAREWDYWVTGYVYIHLYSVQFSSFTQLCPTLCDPGNCSMPGPPVHHQLPDSTQTHVHWVTDAIQPVVLCCPLLFLPSIFPSIRVFSNELAFYFRWPKYWSFSFKISPTDEHPGLISFRMDWLDLLASKGLSRVFSNTTVQKHQFFGTQLSL